MGCNRILQRKPMGTRCRGRSKRRRGPAGVPLLRHESPQLTGWATACYFNSLYHDPIRIAARAWPAVALLKSGPVAPGHVAHSVPAGDCQEP